MALYNSLLVKMLKYVTGSELDGDDGSDSVTVEKSFSNDESEEEIVSDSEDLL